MRVGLLSDIGEDCVEIKEICIVCVFIKIFESSRPFLKIVITIGDTTPLPLMTSCFFHCCNQNAYYNEFMDKIYPKFVLK